MSSSGAPREAFTQRVEAALSALAGRAVARPWLVLALAAVVTALAGSAASTLRIDADLSSLLPDTFHSVEDLHALEKRLGGIGYVVVVGSGAEPEALQRFADDVAPKLEALPLIRYVDHKRPNEWFEDRALYFLDTEDLRTVSERIQARADWERKQRNPMYVDLEGASEPPVLAFDDIRDKYASARDDSIYTGSEPGQNHYLDSDRRMVLLLAKPSENSSDLDFSKRVVRQVEEALGGLDLAAYPGLQWELTGRFKKRIDQQEQISSDLGLASSVAFGLMLLYLAVHFRRIGAVLLVVAPLVVGLIWTFGLTALLFGTLNILTGFIGAILLGLGIDHGIHLLGRYESERSQGQPAHEAIRAAFGSTGRAVVVAALTTVVAFAGIALSEFRAFREFGVIAASGVVMVVLSYVILLPALLCLAERIGWRTATSTGTRMAPYGRSLQRWAPTFMWLALVGLAAVSPNLTDTSFDYDFAALEDGSIRSFVLDKETNRILGYSQTPVAALSKNADEERAVVAELRRRKDELGAASTVDIVAAVSDMVPIEQAEKQPILADIAKAIRRVRSSWFEGETKDQFVWLKRATKAEPFTRAELPINVRRQFAGVGAAADEGFVMVFPAISLADGAAVRRFAEEVREVKVGDGDTIRAVGEAMILADILAMIVREAPPVLLFTIALVFGCLWLLLGSFRKALLCAVPPAATLLGTMALMPLVGLNLNYLNIVLIPVLLGIGVDGGVHLVTRDAEGVPLADIVSETGRAIAGAILTTAFGFGALILADHPGLESLGELAVLGLGVNLICTLVLLPAMLAVGRQMAARRAGTTPTANGGDRLAETASTVGMAGFAPVAPGTLGALVALPMGWYLHDLPTGAFAAVLVAASALSIPVVNRYLRRADSHDPSEVVLDELLGCLIALAFVPKTIPWFLAAFALFRLFDIWKPGPVRVIDRRGPGAWGVMGDDYAAGLFAGLLLFAAAHADAVASFLA